MFFVEEDDNSGGLTVANVGEGGRGGRGGRGGLSATSTTRDVMGTTLPKAPNSQGRRNMLDSVLNDFNDSFVRDDGLV